MKAKASSQEGEELAQMTQQISGRTSIRISEVFLLFSVLKILKLKGILAIIGSKTFCSILTSRSKKDFSWDAN